MALTNEEITYFNEGIDVLFKKKPSKNKALSYIKKDSSNEEILNKLNKFLKKDFITAASSAGIKTPNSLMPLGSGDVSKVHTFVGCHSDHKVVNNKRNINEAVEDLSEDVDTLKNNYGSIETKLEEHNQSISNLYNILHISNTAEAVEINTINEKVDTALNILGSSSYIANQELKTVISCTRSEGIYKLGDIIAQIKNGSILEKEKAFSDCISWTNNKKIDHYLTPTGDAENCTPLIPAGLILTECLEALDLSMNSPYASAQSAS